MKTAKQWLLGLVLAAAVLGTVACQVFPHVDLGIDVDYYNGDFHVRPNASVGITGRP